MIVEFDCEVCGKHARKRRSPANTPKPPRYCSQACHGVARNGQKLGERAPRLIVACAHCGKKARTYRSPSQAAKAPPRFCSLKCLGASQMGENNPSFTGGRYVGPNGYVYVLSPKHPSRDCRGYMLEHRLVAEQREGRYLTEREVVHHVDGNPLNNDPENLQVFASQSEHMRHHHAN